jgi:hypothetical protein
MPQDVPWNLLGMAEPVEVWYTTATQKFEHHWAALLEKAPHFRVPIPRFGSSFKIEEAGEWVHDIFWSSS